MARKSMAWPDRGGDLRRDLAGAVVGLAAVLLIWQMAAIRTGEDHVLPTPARVGGVLGRMVGQGLLVDDLVATVSVTLAGLGWGIVAGVGTGMLFAAMPRLQAALDPFVVAVQSVPKIAFAPLIIAYVGFGPESKILTVALFAFAPCLINTLAGLRGADVRLVEMYHAFSASPLRSFVEVRMPSAAAQVFSGLQVAVSLGLSGAVVSEFIASSEGLGNAIRRAASNMDGPTMFAGIVLLTALGAFGTWVIHLLQRLLVFWTPLGD